MTTLERPRIDHDIAAVLDKAAQIIEDNGLNREKFFGQEEIYWQPGLPCCTVAAVGVALGLRWSADLVERLHADAYDMPPCHPALRAIARHERLGTLRTLYQWSDNAEQAEVVAALQDTAAELRGETP